MGVGLHGAHGQIVPKHVIMARKREHEPAQIRRHFTEEMIVLVMLPRVSSVS